MEVYINETAAFLPNSPVANDDIELYLGTVGNQPSRARNIVLRHNGIKTRYYAIDTDGRPTHSNARLAYLAVRNFFSSSSKSPIELLTAATTTPDQLIPSHASMVHGELGNYPMEIASFAGSCCAGMQALKFAYLSILSGQKNNAVSVASEKPSAWMHARNFESENDHLAELEENPIIAFEKDFLRWMVSDGAGAFYISNKNNEDSFSLRIEWLDIFSFANELDSCMYAGADKNGAGNLKGWIEFTPDEWLKNSVFSIKQDVRLLNDNVVQIGIRQLMNVFERHSFDPGCITYFLPHISSEFFRKILSEELTAKGIEIPMHKWFTNLTRVGNIGSASIYIMLDELFRSDKLKRGDKIFLLVPESARFTYAYCLLTVV